MYEQDLIAKFRKRDAHVVVVGVGYVGLSLAVELSRAGFRVTGYDKDPFRSGELRAGRSYIADVSSDLLASHMHAGRLAAASDATVLRSADAAIICVQTPLGPTREPNVDHIERATTDVVQHLHPGMAIVLESTTYPGTTRELVAAKITAAGGEIGRDVFVAFSPERVEPGNTEWTIRNTPKIVGGFTRRCRDVVCALYEQAIERVVPVSSPDAAEMVKLLENTFRAVNIGLVNEVAIMCKKLGLDTWEVIEAAATKPFGFLPFWPGPGLGGHCIPIDPLYLSWKLRTLKYQARFIELADTINSAMPDHVVALVSDALNERGKAVKGAKILVSGVAYKRDVADLRESPALDVMDGLRRRGAELAYHDPFIPELDAHGADTVPSLIGMKAVEAPHYDGYDAVVIVTDHSGIDYARMAREAALVVDTRNALKSVAGIDPERLVRL